MTVRTRQPDVSIVLPFFQSRGFLAEAIDSILRQEGDVRWELLLVNDGSDELDRQIAEEYRRWYPKKISILGHAGGKRQGISASRNLGIKASGGELIAFLDADDTWLDHKLRSQTQSFKTHPRAGIVYGPGLRWFSWMGGKDVSVPAIVDGFGTDCLVPGEALLTTYLRDEGQTPCIGSVMIRRSVLERVGGFEEQFDGLYDDQVLYAKICREEEVFVSSDCVSRYRKHQQSCCGQAELLGTGPGERDRFLAWLEKYWGLRQRVRAELALPSR